MSNFKHFNYKSSLLAIFFGLLNCVCMASPVLKTYADCNKEQVALQYGYDLNNIETEGESISTYSFKNTHINFAPAKFSSDPNLYNNIEKNEGSENAAVPYISAYLIPEPGYYSFLFQYSLF
ncbi:MAG: hypothetical protein ABIP30_15075 [Ferruginibacter sp.]